MVKRVSATCGWLTLAALCTAPVGCGDDDEIATDGGGGQSVYVACTFDPQPRCAAGYDLCNVFGGGSAPHHCTFTCGTVDSCPAPKSGTATTVCEPGNGPDNVCQLDCSTETCPDGMSCIGTGTGGQVKRCAYNP